MIDSSLRLRDHLTEEQLLRFLDGELNRRERGIAEKHIEACWGCRRRLDQFRLAIDRFAEFEAVTADDAAIAPPNDWNGFGRGLRCVAEANKNKPAPAHLRRAAVLTPAVCASVLIVALWFAPAAEMSAKEVYERSAASERALLSRNGNPLVIQQVRVESAERTAIWSLWRAPSLGQNHQSWNDAHLETEVERLFESHGLDFSRPLSVENHSKWRRSLASADDEVVNDGDLLRVRSRRQQPVAGEIVEAQLAVRTSDWHPVEATFTVSDPSGEKEYRLVEASFRVESINPESARIFEAPKLVIDPTPESSEPVALPPVPVAGIAPPAPPPAAPAGPSLVEIEIDALALVRDLDADRQDSARVDRTGSTVRVTAYAADAARKAVLEKRLAALPSVAVSIHTPSDPDSSMSPEVPVQQAREIAPLFLKVLSRKMGSLAAANALVSRQMNLLWDLTVEAGAAEDLAHRFADEAALKPESRQKLDALAADHLAIAARKWVALEETSGDLTSAMGVAFAPVDTAVCVEWRARSITSAIAARRLGELYARSFTVTANASADQISEESVRTEVPALRNQLAQVFYEGCRR